VEEAFELDVWEDAYAVELDLSYDRGMYSKDRPRAFLSLYASLLEKLCLCPELTVGQLRRQSAPAGFVSENRLQETSRS
jgi:hypothetical protein